MEIIQLNLNEFDSFKAKVIKDLEELKTLLRIKPSDKLWLKSSEVKEMLGISHGKLQTLRNNGTLTFSRIDGVLYYKISDIQELLEQNKSTK